jgi:hypothetical protein
MQAANVSELEGSASIATWEVSAGSRIYPLSAGSSVQPWLGGGLGVVWFQVEGTEATSRYILDSEPLIVAGPHAEIGVVWRLSHSFALRSSLGTSYAFPKPVVEFAGREVLRLGRPLVHWTLGIEFRAVSDISSD